MFLLINGKRYQLKLVRRIVNNDNEADGECDAPHVKGKQIRIRSDLTGRRLLDVLIHEFLHGAFWHLSEESVEQTASEMAAFLWRLGYRLPPDWKQRNKLG
ncbi:MAG: hypothetical protein CMK32_09840 [Porticoccaceae bacterium]|nr:hypothetical protein [Porticoccaceae bacterium]